MAFVYQQVPVPGLSCPPSIIVQFIKADAQFIVFEQQNACDCRIAVLVIVSNRFNFVKVLGLSGDIFCLKVPRVSVISLPYFINDFPFFNFKLVDYFFNLFFRHRTKRYIVFLKLFRNFVHLFLSSIVENRPIHYSSDAKNYRQIRKGHLILFVLIRLLVVFLDFNLRFSWIGAVGIVCAAEK